MFPDAPVPEVFEREIGASVAQFERDLLKAWPRGVRCIGDGHYRLCNGEVFLEIVVCPVEPLRLGRLVMPRVRACYRFEGDGEPARRDLLRRLDRAMQRGGG